MIQGQLPVANARVAITALDTTAQVVFAASGVSADKGARVVTGVDVYGAGVVIFRGNDDIYASGTITLTGLPVALETVTVGTKTYTFVAALTSPAVPNEVKIGATAQATAANLVDAINAGTGAGTTYGTGTTVNLKATAVSRLVAVITLRAVAVGVAGNSEVLTEAATNLTVSGAGTLTGGGSTEYFRMTVAGNETQKRRLPFQVASAAGLEVLTTAATGVGVTAFYYVPTAVGIGA